MELYRNNANKLKSVIAIGLTATAITSCEQRAEAAYPQATTQHPAPEAAIIAPTPDLSDELQTAWSTALKDYPGHIQIAVRDRNSGKVYNFTNAPDVMTYNTASTIKLSILEELLLQNQANNLPLVQCSDHPEIPVPAQMTCEQLDHAISMIENSSDDDASALWVQEGAPATLNDFYSRIGARSTIAEPNSQWGWSQTTATDQLNVLGLLDDTTSPLSASSKSIISFLLDNVEQDQRWGGNGGVAQGVAVRQKEGWMEFSQKTEGNWTINSIANVNNGKGINYDITEYSDDNTSFDSGKATLNNIGAITWNVIAAPAENTVSN